MTDFYLNNNGVVVDCPMNNDRLVAVEHCNHLLWAMSDAAETAVPSGFRLDSLSEIYSEQVKQIKF